MLVITIPNYRTVDEPSWWAEVERKHGLVIGNLERAFKTVDATIAFNYDGIGRDDEPFCVITFPSEEHLTLFLLKL